MSAKSNNNTIIQSLWIGNKLSTLERLCIESFAQNGHTFHLYAYSNIENVPKSAQLKDANNIIPYDRIFNDSRGGVAAFSDWFRYKLLFEKGGWWVDMDMICIKFFDFNDEYCFSTENDRQFNPNLTTGVIKSPPKAEFLEELLIYIESTGNENIFWGEFGPTLLSVILKGYDCTHYSKSCQTFCPIDWFKVESLVSDNNYRPKKETFAIHFWNEIWRIKNLDKDFVYHPQSIFEQLKKKYNVSVQ